MTIKDIKENRILPFEIEDDKLRKLFSFYLHSAPTIESKSAAHIDEERLVNNWSEFKSALPRDLVKIFSASYSNDKFTACFGDCGLSEESIISRRTKAFVCKKKDKKRDEEAEPECHCILRHLRNSIAHDNVYLSNAGNRKYILFEDFNKSGNITARMLFSQADLAALKRKILK